MKLSDLSTNETLDVLCEITPYIHSIVKDEALLRTIGTAVDTSALTATGVMMAGIDRISAAVPMLLNTHRDDVYGILAAVNRADRTQIAAQKLTDTMAQLDDLMHDEELLDFFKSFGQRGKNARSAPSAPHPACVQEDISPSSQRS